MLLIQAAADIFKIPKKLNYGRKAVIAVKINWKKTFGYGIALWAIMFVIVSILIALNFYTDNTLSKIISIIIGAIVVYILAGYAKPESKNEALVMGVSWAIIGIVLDYLITRSYNAGIFKEWSIWISYLLVIVIPTLRVVGRQNPPNLNHQ